MTNEQRSRVGTGGPGFNPYEAPPSASGQPTSEPGDEPAEALTITYSLGPADVLRFKWYYMLRHPWRLAVLVVLAIAMFGAPAMLGFQRGEDQGAPLITAVVYGSFGLLGMGLLLGLKLWGAVRMARATRALSARTVAISPAGIRVTVPGVTDTRMNWGSLHDLAATNRAIFFYLNRIQAFIVPLRAFPSLDSAEAFDSAARRWYFAARAEAKERSR